MKALVLGANGQDGPYLIEALRGRGVEATGFSRSGPWSRLDVADRAAVAAVVARERPDYIFQLAARSTTRHEALYENHAAISTGCLNVLEAVRTHAPAARVFIAGSAVQFRNVGQPIDEDVPFEASSPYAVARIQSVYAARYFRSLGVKAYVGYLFHHESPRRGAGHLSAVIAQAARRIAAGSAETLEIGDPSVVKEWTFAGDAMEAAVTLTGQDDRLRGRHRHGRGTLRRGVARDLLFARGPRLARSRADQERLPGGVSRGSCRGPSVCARSAGGRASPSASSLR